MALIYLGAGSRCILHYYVKYYALAGGRVGRLAWELSAGAEVILLLLEKCFSRQYSLSCGMDHVNEIFSALSLDARQNYFNKKS